MSFLYCLNCSAWSAWPFPTALSWLPGRESPIPPHEHTKSSPLRRVNWWGASWGFARPFAFAWGQKESVAKELLGSTSHFNLSICMGLWNLLPQLTQRENDFLSTAALCHCRACCKATQSRDASEGASMGRVSTLGRFAAGSAAALGAGRFFARALLHIKTYPALNEVPRWPGLKA